MDALSETAYHFTDRPNANPLSPAWFNERQRQVQEGQRREAFGGAFDSAEFEAQATEFIDPDTAIYQGIPVEVVDPVIFRKAIVRFASRVNTETFEDVAIQVFDECFDLLVARQEKYGPKNVEQQGLYGLLVRMRDDKINRIQRALNGKVVNGQIVLDDIDLAGEQGDTLEDAYKDLANYAVISLILLRGKWGKPLAKDVGIDQ